MVSIIMPVYNAERFLHDAANSILNQTYKDFELLIINDGSSDNSLNIINSFNDKRIKVISNTKNMGLIYTLNRGIELADRKYIARMDADDISKLHRLEEQVSFLENNPEIGIVGAQALAFDDNNSKYIYKKPVTSRAINSTLLFESPFIHPLIMGRSEIFKEFKYENEFYRAEDYALWCRVLNKYKGYNLPKILLEYRIVQNSETRLSLNNLAEKKIVHSLITKLLFERLGNVFSSEDVDIFTKFNNRYLLDKDSDLCNYRLLIERICAIVQADDQYDFDYFKHYAGKRYLLGLYKTKNFTFNSIFSIYSLYSCFYLYNRFIKRKI